MQVRQVRAGLLQRPVTDRPEILRIACKHLQSVRDFINSADRGKDFLAVAGCGEVARRDELARRVELGAFDRDALDIDHVVLQTCADQKVVGNLPVIGNVELDQVGLEALIEVAAVDAIERDWSKPDIEIRLPGAAKIPVQPLVPDATTNGVITKLQRAVGDDAHALVIILAVAVGLRHRTDVDACNGTRCVVCVPAF